MSDNEVDTPWYQGGLKFACTRCGNCCTGDPGTVRVSDDEIEALALHLAIDGEEFRSAYLRKLRGGELSLIEKQNSECIFWDSKKGCSVYVARPKQCRTWPFWSAVVHSPETWQAEARDCPGMNQGTLHDAANILATIRNDGTSSDD